jgi:phosphatidylserine decarboxylase
MTKLTHYGRREWISTLVLTAVLVAIVAVVAGRVSWWLLLTALLPLAVCAWVVWFFRDPDRDVPDAPGLLVSPADGRVADITPVGPDSPLGCEGLRIGVFMNVLNVHVNRSPCHGRVLATSHSEGAFLDVRKPEAWERNESATIELAIDAGDGEQRILVRQVAGLVARRIVTDLTDGQQLQRGQRVGMVKFGSRLELWLPASLGARPRVKVGQRVHAGSSVLAAIEDQQES